MDFLVLWLIWQEVNKPCKVLAAASNADPVSDGLKFPEATSDFKTGYFNSPSGLRELHYQEYGDHLLVGGDMMYRIEDLNPSDVIDPDVRNVVSPKSAALRWPNKQVKYSIKANANASMVKGAIAHWERNTDFRFTQSATGDYIEFNNDSTGCSSYVGKIGGKQVIQIEDACGVGSTVHEIGHALGMEHEQTRIDRDEYITYYPERTSSPSNYAINSSTTHEDFGPYDFSSIMHYGSDYFATGSEPVMTKKDGSRIIPNRSALTTCDIDGINKLYEKYPL